MPDTTTPAMGALDDVLTLAALERQDWTDRLDALRASGTPLMAEDGGDGGDGGGDQGDGDPAKGSGDGDPKGAGDDLGDGGQKALAAERKARRDAEKQARELTAKVQEFESRDLTEQQRLEKRASELEGKLTPLEQENARLKVALAKGLTGDKAILAERLRGNTEEELLADADELLKHFGGTPAGGGSGFDGGARGTPAPTDMDAMIRQRAGVAS